MCKCCEWPEVESNGLCIMCITFDCNDERPPRDLPRLRASLDIDPFV